MEMDNKPRYQQIREYLLAEINEKSMQPDARLPSEKELCDLFSVSRITVRKALEGLEECGMVYRVPGRGTFVENRARPELKNRVHGAERHAVGVILATLENPFQVSLLEALERAASSLGFPILFGISNGEKETESRLIDQMVANGVDGIVLYPADGTVYSERVLRLKIENFPVVLIDRYLPGINTCSVYFDNRDGGYQVGRYLIERGHKCIGVLSSPPDMTISLLDRIEGFREAMLNAGIAQPLDYNLYDLDTYCCPSRREGYLENGQRILEFVKGHPEFTALFCVRGNIATCAYRALKSLGRYLELVSFDEIAGFEWTENVRIVEMEHSVEMMGKRAMEQLEKLMDGGEAQNVVIPCHLIRR